jgi:hypothetical protein
MPKRTVNLKVRLEGIYYVLGDHTRVVSSFWKTEAHYDSNQINYTQNYSSFFGFLN